MSDDKHATGNSTIEPTVEESHHITEGDAPRPSGWKYKKFPVVGWYASPKFQLLLVAFVCFLCPGMFNALGGLGGGGKADAKLADDMVSREDLILQLKLGV